MRRIVSFALLVVAAAVVVAALGAEAGWSADLAGTQASSGSVSKTQGAGESFYARSMELPDELLRGAIDIHVHAGPHLKSSPRRVDPLQAAQEAKAAGMRGLVYLDVLENSCGTAWMVSRAVGGIEVFGGIILNTVYGGMNPRAVRTALYYGAGAKFVSFGAHSTYYLASQEGRMVNGKPVPFKDLYPKFAAEELARAIRIPLKDPVPAELDEILKLIAEHPDVFLNTGHVSAQEALRLIELAPRYGIRMDRVLVAHVARNAMTMSQQRQAAAAGAWLEANYADCGVYPGGVPRTHYYPEKDYINELRIDAPGAPGNLGGLGRQIREIGVDHFVLGTDYGIRGVSTPVEGMRQLIAGLLDMEFSVAEIRKLTGGNAARLLGLE
jgi:hypothetical protein